MTGKITIRGRELTYEIVRKKVKNINLSVKSDGRIIVSANNKVSNQYIEDLIIRKADWIEKVLHRFENQNTIEYTEITLTEGTVISLLGKERTLHFVVSNLNKIEVKDKDIIIYTKYLEDNNRLRTQWLKWYEAYTKEVFNQVFCEIYPKFIPYNVKMPVVKLRLMKTRWGSCSVYKGAITLNKALMHTPLLCIEYVVAHELTHFLQPNHSKKFYDMLEIIMPDHKIRKKMLEVWHLTKS